MVEISPPSGARRAERQFTLPSSQVKLESRAWPAQEGDRRLKLSGLFCPVSKVNPLIGPSSRAPPRPRPAPPHHRTHKCLTGPRRAAAATAERMGIVSLKRGRRGLQLAPSMPD